MKDFDFSSQASSAKFESQTSHKPLSNDFQGAHCVHRAHQIVDKDFYRLMRVTDESDKYFTAQACKSQGKAQPEPAIKKANTKYGEPLGEISRQYSVAEVPADRLYMIDKVARYRIAHDRFGIDHSQLLNYEIDQTNKPRDDHMNWLVYKQDSEKHCTPEQDLSVYLKEKLQVTETELLALNSDETNFKNSEKPWKAMQTKTSEPALRNSRPSYKEWLQMKDAQSRLKRKLITQAQDELRQQLLEMASKEQKRKEQKLKNIELWLSRKSEKLMVDETKENKNIRNKVREKLDRSDSGSQVTQTKIDAAVEQIAKEPDHVCN